MNVTSILILQCFLCYLLAITPVLSFSINNRRQALSPSLEFCVPRQTKNAIRDTYKTSKALFLFRWLWGNSDNQVILDDTHYLGHGRKVGFRSCESLGVEIDKNNYKKGKITMGGLLALGNIQVKISINNKTASVVSEILPMELNDICYTHDNLKILSIFPFAEVIDILKNKRTTSKLISIPQALSIDNPFTLYNADKQTRHFVHLFATSEKSYVPLLAPILLAKISPSFISTTAQFSFGLNQYSISIKPTGTRGSGSYEEIYRSSKSGIISEINYGTSITVFSNITFLVTADRSGAYGRDFQKVKRKLVQSVIQLLLKAKVVFYDDIDETKCPSICSNFHFCNASVPLENNNNNDNNDKQQQCMKDQYVKNDANNRIYFINETLLNKYYVNHENITVESVVWKQSYQTSHLHVWSRRNCAPLCSAMLGYNGTNDETQKMSLRELFRFISLWQRFIDFPNEFLNDAISKSPVGKAYGAGFEHAHPISFKVMTQKKRIKLKYNNNQYSQSVTSANKEPEYDDGDDHDDYYTNIKGDDDAATNELENQNTDSNNNNESNSNYDVKNNSSILEESKNNNANNNISSNCSSKEATCKNRTSNKSMKIKVNKSKTYLMTPPHLNPESFEAMWETVLFTSSHCSYIHTPGVQTLDAILSSSLMAACIAWVVILLASWLIIGEFLVYLTSNHGYELPSFFEVVQIPFNTHLVYFIFPQQWFDRWTNATSSSRRGGSNTREIDMSQMNTDFD